jgi:serine/threonine-protein kinase RsbW
VIISPPNILIISSKESELQRVEEFINEVFAFYNFPKTCFNKVLLCISEATINAIAHGNKGDHRKKVELNVDCKTHLISVQITDQGEGFDFTSILDPTHKENIMKESGRGIHIIKSLAKTFSFNEKGNSLQFQIECV